MRLVLHFGVLFILASTGCGGGGGDSFEYEHEINEENPASFDEVAIYHLESSKDLAAGNDSGHHGSDTVHMAGDDDELRTFCLDLAEGENHRTHISSGSDTTPVTLDDQTPCVTIPLHEGLANLSLIHDGVSDAETIFVYQAGEAALAKFKKDGSSGAVTIISSTGCPSCNLEGADLSNRNLAGMDFSGADLRSANVSNSSLQSADLFNARLNDLVSDGASFAGAIWSDGTVCSLAPTNSCTPYTITVQANSPWQSTGLTVRANRQLSFSATGVWTANPANGMVGPGGNSRFIAKPGYTLPGAVEGAIIGRVGSNPPFLIGAAGSSPIGFSGPLLFMINDDYNGIYGAGLRDNIGSIQVTVGVRR